MWMWMSDVQPWFLFCCDSPLKGPCRGPLMPEASFMRQTPSTWRTETLLRLTLAQGSLTSHHGRDSTHSSPPKSLRCDATLTESKYARCQASSWEIFPICRHYGFPPLSVSDFESVTLVVYELAGRRLSRD